MHSEVLNICQVSLKCNINLILKNLKGYDTQRLFAYLSERYLSYWFRRNCRFKEVEWVQLDNF